MLKLWSETKDYEKIFCEIFARGKISQNIETISGDTVSFPIDSARKY